MKNQKKNQKANWIIILIFLIYPFLMALSRAMADDFPDTTLPTSPQPTSIRMSQNGSSLTYGDNFGGQQAPDGDFLSQIVSYNGKNTGKPNANDKVGASMNDPLGN
jgi:hypothetical protein